MTTTLRVNEVFTSIQGEGFHTGIPMSFIRLQGCNMDCEGCDTPDARDPKGGKKLTFEEIAAQLHPRVHWICITGGEPMLQWHKVHLLLFELQRVRKFPVFAMETNGTIKIPYALRSWINWITVSPKMPVLTAPGIPQANEVKFVVEERTGYLLHSDLAVVRDRCRSQTRICVQPWLTGDFAHDKLATDYAAAFAIEHDIRLSIQIHKFIGVK